MDEHDSTPVGGLTAFWIKSPIPHAPLGFGVTARSLADALAIIRAVGYDSFLPQSLKGVDITQGITVGALDQHTWSQTWGQLQFAACGIRSPGSAFPRGLKSVSRAIPTDGGQIVGCRVFGIYRPIRWE
jgi:hypothetical protein